MKTSTILFITSLFIVLIVAGVVGWQKIEDAPGKVKLYQSDSQRTVECERLLTATIFPNSEAADQFLAACLRGETAFPEEPIGEAEQKPRPEPPVANSCVVGGCSSQLCGEASEMEGMVTTCEWREEYACYAEARCERQSNGKCGWTETAAYRQCLSQAAANNSVE